MAVVLAHVWRGRALVGTGERGTGTLEAVSVVDGCCMICGQPAGT